MSCPLNAKRWAGSGYVKCDVTKEQKESDERIAKMIADRAAQDTTYFPQIQSKPELRSTQQNGSAPKVFQS
jgi:hypothetical protein